MLGQGGYSNLFFPDFRFNELIPRLTLRIAELLHLTLLNFEKRYLNFEKS